MAAKKKKEEKTEKVNMEEMFNLIGENDQNQGVSEYLTTGIMPLNYMLSGKYLDGGFGCGRIHEVYGASSSGKTLIATRAMIEAQKKGGIAFFLDYEHSFDATFANRQGLLTGKSAPWLYKQEPTAEQGFKKIEEIANKMVQSYPNTHICVIVDSIASMKTEAEMVAGFDSNMKTKLSLAACLSASLKQLVPIVSSCNMTLIFLNQVRKNPSVSFGDPTALPGGESLKFYASTRTKLSKTGKIYGKVNGKEADENGNKFVLGENIKAMTVKNKIYPPFKNSSYVTEFGSESVGIDMLATHMPDFLNRGVIEKAGSWYSLNGERIGQGIEKVKQTFIDNEELFNEVMKKTYSEEIK